MKKETHPWVKKAEEDLFVARRAAQCQMPLHDVVCFHGQQCAEKYLKGLLVELDLSVPKVHDLDRLLADLLPIHPTLNSLSCGSKLLSTFAVALLYPGDDANKRQARAALRWAEKIRAAARGLLGI